MHVEAHLPLEELKRLERVEKDADRTRRMRIIILAAEGWTVTGDACANTLRFPRDKKMPAVSARRSTSRRAIRLSAAWSCSGGRAGVSSCRT